MTAKPKRRISLHVIEAALHGQGYVRVCGIDEAGRGPLAGPVCAAAVIFEPGVRIRGVNDSKQVEPEQREELFGKIMEKALATGIGWACAEEIDSINILEATKLAAARAIRRLAVLPDYLVLDALHLRNMTTPQESFIKGDGRCFSIAAASILAKVSRDRLMVALEEEFPEYGFARHKGYGTQEHRKALDGCGPSTLHRQSFLGQWFGATVARCSKNHESRKQALAGCECPVKAENIWREIPAHLPKCEVRELQNARANKK